MTNEEIIKELSGKTVLEINELVKALEEAWGVSAAAAVAVAGPAAGAAPAEEKTEFDVILKAAGANKIGCQQDRGHQGDPRDYGSRPQGRQGHGRRRSQEGQGSHREGRGREDRRAAQEGRRRSRGQVIRYDCGLKTRRSEYRAPRFLYARNLRSLLDLDFGVMGLRPKPPAGRQPPREGEAVC